MATKPPKISATDDAEDLVDAMKQNAERLGASKQTLADRQQERLIDALEAIRHEKTAASAPSSSASSAR